MDTIRILCMSYGFFCLSHDTIISSDHQNYEVCHMSPTRPHGVEGCMARGVQERDLLT